VVDVATVDGPVTWRASGFLFGLSDAAPADALIDPTRPQMFRTAPFYDGLNPYPRMRARTATIVRVIGLTSDPVPGEGGDYSAWEQHVRDVVNAADTAGQSYQYDIWNEPDLTPWPAAWPDARFLETWRRGVAQVRALHADAVIVGPSVSFFDLTAMQAFLNFAVANGVVPDILSWHEFGPWAGIPPPDQIPVHVQSIRDYTNGFVNRFQINEWMGLDQRYRPGVALWFFANLERANVENAERSCWNDECFDTSLGGLLTPTTLQPRSVWWAHKAYGDLAGQRVAVTPSAALDGVASVDVNSLVVGVGNHADSAVTPQLNILAMPGALAGCAHVTAQAISNTEDQPLVQLATAVDENRTFTGSQLDLTLPSTGAGAAWLIRLGPCL